MYRIKFTSTATNDVLKLQKSEHKAYLKLERVLIELREHPTTGTGKPEPLKGNRAGQWSRRINKKPFTTRTFYATARTNGLCWQAAFSVPQNILEAQ